MPLLKGFAAAVLFGVAALSHAQIYKVEVGPPLALSGAPVTVTVSSTKQQLFCAFEVDFGNGKSEAVRVDPMNGLFPRSFQVSYDEAGFFNVVARGVASGLHGPCQGESDAAHIALPVKADREAARRIAAQGLVAYASDRNRGRLKNAYVEALKHDPGFGPAHLGLGVAHELDGELRQARGHFRLAAASFKTPNSVQLATEMAERLTRRSGTESSADRKYFDRVNQARLLVSLNMHQQALVAAREALGLSPRPWQAQVLLGEAYQGANEFRQAVDAYKAAADTAPAAAQAHIRQLHESLTAQVSRMEDEARLLAAVQSGDQARAKEASPRLVELFESNPDRADLGVHAAIGLARSGDLRGSEVLLSKLPTLGALSDDRSKALSAVQALREEMERETYGIYGSGMPATLMSKLRILRITGEPIMHIAVMANGAWVVSKGTKGIETSDNFPSHIRADLESKHKSGSSINWVSIGRDSEVIASTTDSASERLYWWGIGPQVSAAINEIWGKEYVGFVALTKDGGHAIVKGAYGFTTGNLPQNALNALWRNYYLQKNQVEQLRQIVLTGSGGYVLLMGQRGFSYGGIPQALASTIAYTGERSGIRTVAVAPSGGWVLVLEKPL